jgi:sRNA-binding regulator protein Hfq
MTQAPVADQRRPHRASAGHTPDVPGATPATGALAKPPFVAVQNGWLKRLRGQTVSIRLGSGEVIGGVLVADDSYTLELRIPGRAETALVFKHSVEYLVPAGDR